MNYYWCWNIFERLQCLNTSKSVISNKAVWLYFIFIVKKNSYTPFVFIKKILSYKYKKSLQFKLLKDGKFWELLESLSLDQSLFRIKNFLTFSRNPFFLFSNRLFFTGKCQPINSKIVLIEHMLNYYSYFYYSE